MKNIANYIIGFVFLLSILLSFVGVQRENLQPKRLIPRLFFAVLLVHSSFFLIRALLDLSTVATYAIGGIPMQVVGNVSVVDKDGKPAGQMNTPFCPRSVYLNLSSVGSSSGDVQFLSYVKTKSSGNMIECVFEEDGKVPSHTLNVLATQTNIAIASNFAEQTKTTDEAGKTQQGIGPFMQSACFVSQSELLNIEKDLSALKNDDVATHTVSVRDDDGAWKDPDERLLTAGTANPICSTLDDLIQGAKGVTGPLYGLLGSMMSTTDVAIQRGGATLDTQAIQSIIKGVMILALTIPLIVLAIVLVMRVAYLWLIIGFAPLLALMIALGLKGPGSMSKMTERFSLGSVIGIIFLPVVVTFAISMGLVFISALTAQTGRATGGKSLAKLIDLDSNGCYQMAGVGSVCMKGGFLGQMGSYFGHMTTYLIINLFGIAILWTVVFVALKTSKLTAGVAESVQNLAQKGLMSLPVVPIPGGSPVGIGAVGKGISTYASSLPRELQADQTSKVSSAIQRGFNLDSESQTFRQSLDAFDKADTAADQRSQLSNISNTIARGGENISSSEIRSGLDRLGRYAGLPANSLGGIDDVIKNPQALSAAVAAGGGLGAFGIKERLEQKTDLVDDLIDTLDGSAIAIPGEANAGHMLGIDRESGLAVVYSGGSTKKVEQIFNAAEDIDQLRGYNLTPQQMGTIQNRVAGATRGEDNTKLLGWKIEREELVVGEGEDAPRYIWQQNEDGSDEGVWSMQEVEQEQQEDGDSEDINEDDVQAGESDEAADQTTS